MTSDPTSVQAQVSEATTRMGKALAKSGSRLGVMSRLPADLMIAEVSARDANLMEVDVFIHGDTSEALSGVQVAPSYYPRVGDRALILAAGSGPTTYLAFDALNHNPGYCHLLKTGSAAINSGANTLVSFSDLGAQLSDPEMFDEATDNEHIIIRWPGLYIGGVCGLWTGHATGRRILDILVGTEQVATARKNSTDTGDWGFTALMPGLPLLPEETVAFQVFQSSGGPLSVSQTGSMSPLMWVRWQGPYHNGLGLP